MRGGVKPEECYWNPAGSRLLRGALVRGMAGKEKVRKREVRQGGGRDREGTELTRAKENILHLIDFVDRFK